MQHQKRDRGNYFKERRLNMKKAGGTKRKSSSASDDDDKQPEVFVVNKKPSSESVTKKLVVETIDLICQQVDQKILKIENIDVKIHPVFNGDRKADAYDIISRLMNDLEDKNKPIKSKADEVLVKSNFFTRTELETLPRKSLEELKYELNEMEEKIHYLKWLIRMKETSTYYKTLLFLQTALLERRSSGYSQEY
jgi:hypothetical protein